jgi:hypothetical protein
VLGLSAKLNSRAAGLAVTSDLKVIFIIKIIIFLILIVILNLLDLDLSGSSCNARRKSLKCGFDYKVVS